MQNEPQNAGRIQPEAPANALFYFRAERFIFSTRKTVLLKNKSPLPICLPLIALKVLGKEPTLKALHDYFASLWENIESMHLDDIDARVIPERVVWAGGEYVFPNY